MSIKFKISAFALWFLALGLVAGPIRAATPTASFGVTVTVQASCLITATSIPLGDYAATVVRAKPNISVICTNPTRYTVHLRAGLTSGPTVPNRWMGGPVSALSGYAPVSNFQRIVNRGQTKGIDTAGETGNGFSRTLSVPSQILAKRYVAASAFADLITVTVTY